MALNINLHAPLKYWKPVRGCIVLTLQLECFVHVIHAGVVAIIAFVFCR